MYCLAADIKTGKLLSELPLSVSGNLQRALMTVSDAEFALPLHDPRCPGEWEAHTAPWRVTLAVVDDSDTLVWAGIPVSRTRKAGSGVLTVKTTSVEGYLARRRVPAHTFTQADQCSVIARWLVESTLDAGLPMELDTPASGVLRDRTYTDSQPGTVLQRLTDLAGVMRGPEWWIETCWADTSKTALKRVFHTGYPRIGVASTSPQAVFEMPGGLSDLTCEERWGPGEAATFVVTTAQNTTSSDSAAAGAGGALASKPHVDTAQEWAGYPRLETWLQPNNATQLDTLESRAARTLAETSHGVKVYSLKQRADAAPKLGVDWAMGDDVRLRADTDVLKVDTTCRLVGWEVTLSSNEITPIVAKLDHRTPDKPAAKDESRRS